MDKSNEFARWPVLDQTQKRTAMRPQGSIDLVAQGASQTVCFLESGGTTSGSEMQFKLNFQPFTQLISIIYLTNMAC